ncbi:MAG: 2,3-bisphosphoglycerate-independent phosphoglycerate mutase [Candidatus Gracilibacteria bacterium]|nr:2,3-bisphosphoglycerate-independent phosphoglycerate mutase [Candidatus Gracilibacteria bacterium]
MQKVSLIILDGFGINNKTLEENAIYKADTPNFDKLFLNLYTSLDASGLAVGIPEGQMGNSEVGHMTIGAGKVIKQNLVKINESFKNNDFEKIQAFRDGIINAKNNTGVIHLLTLFGSGGVHSDQNHLIEILKIIPENLQISLHLFGDGRDLEPNSMLGLLEDFEKNILSNYKNVIISSISGRYFAMDRDNNWDRIKKAYDTIVFGENKTSLKPLEFVKNNYENNVFDEFLPPTFFECGAEINNFDSVFFLNFRSDRARELTQALIEKSFSEFKTKSLVNIFFVSMTKYYKEYDGNYFIIDEKVENCLGEVLQNNNLTQLHIAETEKFAHVTKFFNGGKQIVFEKELDILISSHKVATYDLDPEMSAGEIWGEFEKNANNLDFTVVNFANGDMVGHTGSLEASIKAVEKLDEIVGKLIDFCDKNDIDLLITADHGNCEEMGTLANPKTSHTTNFVPFWYIKNREVLPTKQTGGLSNIAPTILKLMGIENKFGMDESLI